MDLKEHNWQYSTIHNCACKVIEAQTLWGETTCRVWLPSRDSVVRIPAARLKSLESAGTGSPDDIAYVAAAARVADAMSQDILLAPIESSVIPLPHQIRALSRAIASDRVRYLLADEVGLGKTIEAGLILRELKLSGLLKRTLVIAPKGLVTQWVTEMRSHFHEHFHLILPEDIKTLRRVAVVPSAELRVVSSEDSQLATRNSWTLFSQVVVPMDAVKPLDKRRGWTAAQVGEYNRERFEDLISARWDLVIVDEAHRLGGSTDQVARFKLGQGLAEAAPYLLLLSATPHQGKTDAFHRLMSLIDAQAFPDTGSVTRERVQPYVIRTEKRHAIDAEGKPLFKPRRTQLAPVSWNKRHRDQQLLYEVVTEYVREGYNQAMQEKRSYIGFLMILMQRLVVSSTHAIKSTLARRLEVLRAEDSGLRQTQLSEEGSFTQPSVLSPDDFYDLDGQEQMETLLHIRLKALKNEHAEVKLMLEAAARCEQAGPDAKAEALLDWLYRLQAEESDAELKTLVFTEFVPTQEMLRRFLTERGFSVVCLNGSMDMEERQRVQEAFAREARILISTDAGGEGLNLQFCHVVINYDIPWNPMRLEQRIGRVDRIGQVHTVRAINFVLEDTVDHRVQEVLEAKLAVILEEFGVDKTGDVLDSAQAGQMFDALYMEAILHPETWTAKAASVVSQVQEQARATREHAAVLGAAETLDPAAARRLMVHPLPFWIERMTTSYLRSTAYRTPRADAPQPGATVVGKEGQHTIWRLVWPDGHEHIGCFTHRVPSTAHLGLEEPRIRGLAMRLPQVAPGQPIPTLVLPGLPTSVQGLWSLWRVGLSTTDWNRQRVMALFLHKDGRLLLPTARHIWDQMLSHETEVVGHIQGAEAHYAFARLREAAETQGQSIYDELVLTHRDYYAREREKGEYAFAVRQHAVERIGLPAVRHYRLAQLAHEEQVWREQLSRMTEVQPELIPLLIVQVIQGM
jgi:superfamily II DNA or RNA helicase